MVATEDKRKKNSRGFVLLTEIHLCPKGKEKKKEKEKEFADALEVAQI